MTSRSSRGQWVNHSNPSCIAMTSHEYHGIWDHQQLNCLSTACSSLKKILKLCIAIPLCWEFTSVWWMPHRKGLKCRMCFQHHRITDDGNTSCIKSAAHWRWQGAWGPALRDPHAGNRSHWCGSWRWIPRTFLWLVHTFSDFDEDKMSKGLVTFSR